MPLGLEQLGSIPAHAGETALRCSQSRHLGVDPRSRGGDGIKLSHLPKRRGRSPLTRGRHDHEALDGLPFRSIPAHAGETLAPLAARIGWKVDPRSRGGDGKT